MSGGNDIMDDFAGPRTLRYFVYLLLFVVLLYTLGAVLSTLHDFKWLELFAEFFVERPRLLFSIAGIIAFFVFAFIALRAVMNAIESY